MKINSLFYIISLAAITLTSCTDGDDNAAGQSANPVELTGIKTTVSSPVTRAGNEALKGTAGYIGRQFFVGDDIMVLTKFQRTSASISTYSYTDVMYKSNSDGAWTREISDGYSTADRIYWTDNANPHTFIGYSCPKSWTSDKWQKGTDAAALHYYGAFTKDAQNVVDFSDSTKLASEDILLTYDTQKQAEVGGSVAVLHYKHALASTKITVNIQNFATNGTTADSKAKVYDLEILEQPWKYEWSQIPVPGEANSQGDTIKVFTPGWGVQNLTNNATDGSVTLKSWLRNPDGTGLANNKTFVFRSLVVPGKQQVFKLRFKVAYPDALNPSQTVVKTYTANVHGTSSDDNSGVYFRPGYCTNINISLNHRNEKMTIGAEYIEWENVEIPDQTNLSKYSTYLSTTERAKVTVAGDPKATKDDATWLYYDAENENKLVDLYGNDGTAEHPFEIRTALQFLSFAYEVSKGNDGSGRSFEGKFVKLDASLVFQPTTDVAEKESLATVSWIGIGDASHPFSGTFNGGSRYIRYLKGNPLFNNIGANGVVENITLENVLGITDGGGMLAGTNAGRICASLAVAHVGYYVESTGEMKLIEIAGGSSSGAFCCNNTGTIFACGAIGDLKEAVCGLCATNSGTVEASYSGITNTGCVVGTGTVKNCYYDSSKATGSGDDGSTGMPTNQMQLTNFVTTLNNAISSSTYAHKGNHTFEFRAAYYPNVK